MIPAYALQQLRAAIKVLASGTDCLQKRLEAAYQELEPLIAADFPPGLGKSYQDIVAHFSRRASVAETISTMSDGEASQLAALMVDLHFATEAAEAATTSSNESSVEADSPLAAR